MRIVDRFLAKVHRFFQKKEERCVCGGELGLYVEAGPYKQKFCCRSCVPSFWRDSAKLKFEETW